MNNGYKLRVSKTIQTQKEKQANNDGFVLDIDFMVQMIGGSTLDDLRELMGIEHFIYNEDILFKLIDKPSEEEFNFNSDSDIPLGKTYLATCTAVDSPNYIMCIELPEKYYFAWKKQ